MATGYLFFMHQWKIFKACGFAEDNGISFSYSREPDYFSTLLVEVKRQEKDKNICHSP